MTNGLLISRRTKSKLYNISIRRPSAANTEKFRTFRNLYATVVRLSKKLYYQHELALYQSDSKKTWEILRKALNKSKKNGSNVIQSINCNGTSFSNPREIADKFNEFFSNAALNIVDNIPNPVPLNNDDVHCDSVFKFSDCPLTKTEISDAIDQLKPKSSLDFNGLSSKFGY
jgi:hypothetical protein